MIANDEIEALRQFVLETGRTRDHWAEKFFAEQRKRKRLEADLSDVRKRYRSLKYRESRPLRDRDFACLVH